MLWKKESALTVRNTTIMTRSRSLFFKIFCSTRIHPQQESRGDPSSVLTLPDTTVYCSIGFLPGNVSHTCIFCLFVCFWLHRVLIAMQASVELRPGGFSPRWRLLSQVTGSRALGLQTQAQTHGLSGSAQAGSSQTGVWTVSLELQSRFMTTGAPEKPWKCFGLVSVRVSSCHSLLRWCYYQELIRIASKPFLHPWTGSKPESMP